MAAILPAPLVGSDTEVPCADGRLRRYVNLDYAASAPPLVAVWEAVEAFMPWYSSVHRGSGYKSQISTAAYEAARADVTRFVGARWDDTAVFFRNTTEALNVLAGFALERGDMDEARGRFREALALGGTSPGLRGRIEQNLGILANVRG